MTKTKASGRAVVLAAQSDLFATVSGLIEEARRTLASQANSTTVFLFWRIGQQVNSEILYHQRAEYGQSANLYDGWTPIGIASACNRDHGRAIFWSVFGAGLRSWGLWS
ncbi:MAG: hypothetical protein M3N91_14265 [Pseudomonadota bacterium]|nr:hypothetical protein [Pseudomonadota bacterium]